MNSTGWVALIGALVAGLGGTLAALFTRRKINAEAESTAISTMQKVVESVRGEMQRLQSVNENLQFRLNEIEHENSVLRFRVARLEEWMVGQGHDPDTIRHKKESP